MDIEIWAIFFAGIVSIKEHPRNTVGANIPECAKIADQMYVEYQCRKNRAEQTNTRSHHFTGEECS